MDATLRQTWATTGWTIGVVATILNGIVVGYGILWFQIGGSGPDADDYQLSAGGYAAAAAVLLLSLPALLARDRSGWLVPVTLVAGVLLVLLGLRSALSISDASDQYPGSVLEGVGSVLWAPWTWVMVLLGVRALLTGRHRVSSVSSDGSTS